MTDMIYEETILTPEDLSKMWTELAQDDQTPDHFELTEHGEVVMSPNPTNRHQMICADIAFELRTQLGGKAVQEAAVLTTSAGVRIPDVVWMPEEKWNLITTSQDLLQAPDLVVEVLSPGNRHSEITHKVQAYLTSGVKEVIIVNLTGTIDYCRQDGVHSTSRFPLTLSLPSTFFQ